MSINPGMVVPFSSKNPGELFKNSWVNRLLTAVLKAVETLGAHKFTGRKQGVSCCLFIFGSIDANFSNLVSFLYLLSFHGVRWQICCSSQGQHMSSIIDHGTLWNTYHLTTRFCQKLRWGIKGLFALSAILVWITLVHEDLSEEDQLSVHIYVEYK